MQTGSKDRHRSPVLQVLSLLTELRNLYSAAGMAGGTRKVLLPDSLLADRCWHWLNTCSQVLDQLEAHELGALFPDWDNPDNLRLFFKLSARNLATCLKLPYELRRSLNLLGNKPPLCHKDENGRVYGFNFLQSRKKLLAEQLAFFKGRTGLKWLHVSPEDGLVASWLVEEFLVGQDGLLHCIDLLPPLLPERALYDVNLSLPFVKHNIFHREQEGRGALFTGELTDDYDLVFIEGLRRPTELGRTVLSQVEKLMPAWKALRLGGVLMVDDQLLRENLVAMTVWTVEPTSALQTFLSMIPGQYRTLQQSIVTTVQKTRA